MRAALLPTQITPIQRITLNRFEKKKSNSFLRSILTDV